MKQVMVRTKELHGNCNRLTKATVLSEQDGIMQVKLDGAREADRPIEVKASDTIPVDQVYKSANPGMRNSIVTKSFTPAQHALSNRYK